MSDYEKNLKSERLFKDFIGKIITVILIPILGYYLYQCSMGAEDVNSTSIDQPYDPDKLTNDQQDIQDAMNDWKDDLPSILDD